jgi:hypothetical protein
VDIAAAVVAAGKISAGKVKSNWGRRSQLPPLVLFSRGLGLPACAASGLRRGSRTLHDGVSSRIEEQEKETAYGHAIAYYLPKKTKRNGAR